MKRSDDFNVDLAARFSESELEQIQMNFLRGGDGDGGQDPDDPWGTSEP